MEPLDLIKTARLLAGSEPDRRKPSEADLKRAISTAYYALFHAIARNAADRFAGTGRELSEPAWLHVYRALEHRQAKVACEQARNPDTFFPPSLFSCADAFVELQKARHAADYDPNHRVSKTDALGLIRQMENAIRDLQKANAADLTAFVVQVLLRKRSS
ncbi:MAG: hypothetical protein MUE49_07215 [Rhodospirillales bacterium]|jgi:hypothetical protein|nr:hypothetical protein [Rhodospirillales bacterium]